MAVIVTGAAGLIGSNLSSKLLNKGYKVIGIDNLVLGKKINLKDLKNKKNFKFRKLDLSNFKLTNSFFLELKKKYRIDTVWH